METFILSLLIILVLGIIDYFAYNIVYRNTLALHFYRVIQNISWILISYNLFIIKPIYAFQFLILYFGWLADWVYYFICELTDGFGTKWLPGKGAIKSEVLSDSVVWAWWTFVGIFTRWIPGKKDVPIKGIVLIIQSVVCILISLLIGL